MGNQSLADIKDLRCATVIHVQDELLGVSEHLLEVKDIPYRCPGERIYALPVVSTYPERTIPVSPGYEQPQDAHLRGIGVLEFIDQYMRILVLILLPDVFVLFQ